MHLHATQHQELEVLAASSGVVIVPGIVTRLCNQSTTLTPTQAKFEIGWCIKWAEASGRCIRWILPSKATTGPCGTALAHPF